MTTSARDFIAFHSSWDKVKCVTGLSITVKSYSFTLLRKISKCGSALGGFQDDAIWNAGFSLKSNVSSLRKCHLILIRRRNSPKSDLNLGSLIFLCMGAKFKPFSKTLISLSERTSIFIFLSTNIFKTRTHLSFLSQIITNAVVYINLAFVQIRTFV